MKEIKDKIPEGFRENLPSGPPDFAVLEKSPVMSAGTHRQVGKEPGFKDPDRRQQEYDLGDPGDISDRVKAEGLEAIAWYLPFHSNETNWGVYIHWTRFKQLASYIARVTQVSSAVSLGDVYDELIAHELFHCRTEIFSTIGEELRQSPLFLAYSDQYRKLWGTENCVEESLATSYGLAHVKNRTVRTELERISDTMPGGYKQWRNFPYSPAALSSGLWWRGIAELTDQITGDWDVGSWELSAHLVTRKILLGVPRYLWFEGKSVPDDVFSYFVQHRDFIDCLSTLYPKSQVELINTGKGKHPYKLSINGRRIPYKTSWDGVPPFIFNQVAQIIGIKSTELREQIRSQLA